MGEDSVKPVMDLEASPLNLGRLVMDLELVGPLGVWHDTLDVGNPFPSPWKHGAIMSDVE
jgi:hypothetical protein